MAKTFSKFGANPYGITNSTGELCTLDYVRRYIHCWCRVSDGFVLNRKANIEYFMSDAYLRTCAGLTASQIGHKASLDVRWGRRPTAKVARNTEPEIVIYEFEPGEE